MSKVGDRILATEDRKQENCGAWGEKFYVQELSADDWEWIDKSGAHEARKLAMVIVRAAVDDTGARVFKDQNVQGLSCRKSVAELQRVADQILDLSGLSAKAQEALEKNSAGTSKTEHGTDSDSPSTSQTSSD